MRPAPPPIAFGPEVLLVFVGHADDADAEVKALLAVEPDLRRAVEQLLAVAGSAVPYRTLRLWEWNRDAPPGVGGQVEVITPVLDRADAAVFVFKERVGPVSWAELERCRAAGRPVLAFFPDAPPPGRHLKDPAVAAAWLDLLEKQRALTDGWDAPDSQAVTPMPEYRDAAHLAAVALDQLKVVATGLLRPRPQAVAPAPARFLGDHDHLGYDRRPVLAHAVGELDLALVQAFLDRPLSQEPLTARRLRRVGLTDHLALLGCLTDGRPTLGAFLCFAPLPLLADKFDGCAMQLVAYTETDRATAQASITTARGNLLELFDEGMAWLTTRAGLRRRGRVGDADRDDLEVPEIVLREVLANALVHRDYETPALRDQPTRVEVYPDRVEVTSFGDLPATVPVEALNADPERVAPYRRNPVVARVFQHMSHAELNASGLPRMRGAMDRAGLPPPRFATDLHRNVVRVILLRPSAWADPTPAPGPPESRRRVFIGSTMSDLPEHRRSVMDACHRLGFLPVGLEWLPATSGGAVPASLEMVDQADVYLGIFGHRYGHVPAGSEKSITELEYDRARQLGLPTLVFFIHEDHPVRKGDVEVGPGVERLERLKQRLGRELVVAFFRSPEELHGQVLHALAALRARFDSAPPTRGGPRPLPSRPFVAHPFRVGNPFVGRRDELGELDAWLAGEASPPVFCLAGLAGTGKSSVAWEFFNRAGARTPPLAGRMWWSFSDGGPFDEFSTAAVAYATGRPAEEVRGVPAGERDRLLYSLLDSEPYLVVLDGVEQQLNAYAQPTGGPYRKAVDPRLEAFLRRLPQSRPARVLLATRLVPVELEPPTGPVPGCRVRRLGGLATGDVAALFAGLGIRGSEGAYNDVGQAVEHHPLALVLLAGVVAGYRPAPGDLDRWLRDGMLAGLRALPLAEVRNAILGQAMSDLEERSLAVLSALAAEPGPADYDTLADIVGPGCALADRADLDAALHALDERGLVTWDRRANRYGIHPLVRAAVAEPAE